MIKRALSLVLKYTVPCITETSNLERPPQLAADTGSHCVIVGLTVHIMITSFPLGGQWPLNTNKTWFFFSSKRLLWDQRQKWDSCTEIHLIIVCGRVEIAGVLKFNLTKYMENVEMYVSLFKHITTYPTLSSAAIISGATSVYDGINTFFICLFRVW